MERRRKEDRASKNCEVLEEEKLKGGGDRVVEIEDEDDKDASTSGIPVFRDR